ncbi:MAG: dihydrodipicolinate synthase family protein [Alphaproteobacteria bacterium]|nr:dihydrodipicolinate synthase family protein [Alphaproteobacteria bacterium]
MTRAASDRAYRGIVTILYAFFDTADQLDREAMRRQVEACISAGTHGIAALGLATEVSKLSADERRRIMNWTCEDVAGRVPVALTIFGATPAEQIDEVLAAERVGADWVILQPPREPALSEDELIGFFGAVADESALPVAIQNAPEFLGVGLTPQGFARLAREHPNVQLLKAEGSALSVHEIMEATGHRLTVFNGRGGLELPDNLRAGCAGMIPAPDCMDRQVQIYELMQTGVPEDEAEAERLYAEILPCITFVMQSLDTLICYGKRIAAHRLGLHVHDRAPALAPNAFGLACAERYATALGPLG